MKELENIRDDLRFTMTTWKGRINQCHLSVESLVNLGLEGFLVLSSDELKFEDITPELHKFIDNGDLRVIWYKDNIKCYKKVVPTMRETFCCYNLLSVDDDIDYSNKADEIRRMYSTFKLVGPDENGYMPVVVPCDTRWYLKFKDGEFSRTVRVRPKSYDVEIIPTLGAMTIYPKYYESYAHHWNLYFPGADCPFEDPYNGLILKLLNKRVVKTSDLEYDEWVKSLNLIRNTQKNAMRYTKKSETANEFMRRMFSNEDFKKRFVNSQVNSALVGGSSLEEVSDAN